MSKNPAQFRRIFLGNMTVQNLWLNVLLINLFYNKYEDFTKNKVTEKLFQTKNNVNAHCNKILDKIFSIHIQQ